MPRDLVEASGIENDQRPSTDTMGHQEGSIGIRDNSADVSDRASKCPIGHGDVTESSAAYELSNVVETALAKALVLAAEAKRWDVVVLIAERNCDDDVGRSPRSYFLVGGLGELGLTRTTRPSSTRTMAVFVASAISSARR